MRFKLSGGTIIVGVDAGETTAIAIVSFEGKPLKVESHKHWSLGDVIGKIAAFSPAVIACDTNPTSGFARELKRAFGARLVFPRRSLHVYEKERMAHDAGLKVHNKHERDALAAALKAYHLLQNKLRQAGRKAEIKAGVKRGKSDRGKSSATSKEVAQYVESIQRRVLGGEKMRHAIANN